MPFLVKEQLISKELVDDLQKFVAGEGSKQRLYYYKFTCLGWNADSKREVPLTDGFRKYVYVGGLHSNYKKYSLMGYCVAWLMLTSGFNDDDMGLFFSGYVEDVNLINAHDWGNALLSKKGDRDLRFPSKKSDQFPAALRVLQMLGQQEIITQESKKIRGDDIKKGWRKLFSEIFASVPDCLLVKAKDPSADGNTCCFAIKFDRTHSEGVTALIFDPVAGGFRIHAPGLFNYIIPDFLFEIATRFHNLKKPQLYVRKVQQIDDILVAEPPPPRKTCAQPGPVITAPLMMQQNSAYQQLPPPQVQGAQRRATIGGGTGVTADYYMVGPGNRPLPAPPPPVDTNPSDGVYSVISETLMEEPDPVAIERERFLQRHANRHLYNILPPGDPRPDPSKQMPDYLNAPESRHQPVPWPDRSDRPEAEYYTSMGGDGGPDSRLYWSINPDLPRYIPKDPRTGLPIPLNPVGEPMYGNHPGAIPPQPMYGNHSGAIPPQPDYSNYPGSPPPPQPGMQYGNFAPGQAGEYSHYQSPTPHEHYDRPPPPRAFSMGQLRRALDESDPNGRRD